MPIVLEVFLANLLTRSLALIGAYVISSAALTRLSKILPAVACGFLTAVATTHLLPEAFESNVDPHMLGLVMLGTLLVFPILGLVVGGKIHDHHLTDASLAEAPSTNATSVITGGALHSFVDGFLVATAFFVDSSTGWSVAFAVLAHELPQQVGFLVILEKSGYSRVKAILICSFISLVAVAGGIIGSITLIKTAAWMPYALAISGMSFLFIALFALLPETLEYAKTAKERYLQIMGLIFGAFLSILILGVTHEVEHEAHHLIDEHSGSVVHYEELFTNPEMSHNKIASKFNLKALRHIC